METGILSNRNQFRKEITSMFRSVSVSRPATLRRSLMDDSLYATDLPLLLPDDQLKHWLEMAENLGWSWKRDGDWILLDRPVPDEYIGRYSGPYGNEASCCVSLLERGKSFTESSAERRMLMKAGERGPYAFEKLCGILHAEWAERLRKNEPLPDLPLSWFQST